MKNTGILILLMIFIYRIPSAHAQSSVTLYGVIDTSIELTNAGRGTTLRMDSGADTGSRYGLRGVEDIGGGTHINFQLENGFYSNSGAAFDTTREFSRQAWIGVSNEAWGEIKVGRQHSPVYIPVVGRFDSFNDATLASALNNFQTITVRNDNAISYWTPDIKGITAQVMVGLRSTDTHPTNGINNVHVAVEYLSGPISLATAYQQTANANGTSQLKNIYVGGSYAISKFRIYGVFYHGRQTDESMNKDVASTSFEYTISPSQIASIGYGQVWDHTAARHNADNIGLMYKCILSKRTTLYADASYLFNHGSSAYTLNGAALAGIAVTPGFNPRGVQFGILHYF